MQLKKADRQLLMLIGVVVCVAVLWWAIGSGGSSRDPGLASASSSTIEPTGSAGSSPDTRITTEPGPRDSPDPAATPVSGLPTIAESRLPRQAIQTLELIRAGGPYPYAADEQVFQNRERLLPQRARGYYREYTVRTPGSQDRGARRIIGGTGGDRYYTEDHYDSFRQILEGQ